jgi:glucose 1-dehydrogenase
MRAIVVHPPSPGATLEEMPEPAAAPGELTVRVLECGICGTDRDIVAGKYGAAPVGATGLILGHENLGRIVEAGGAGSPWNVGELVVATVRRACGECRFCFAGRSDFCESGHFTERGISGRHGYLAERYTESPEYLVRVPAGLAAEAVLLEPLSVVEKAVSEGQAVLARFEPTPGYPRARPYRALVTGTGAIGMLAALLLVTEGYEVVAIDRHDDATPAGQLLRRIGAEHVNTRDGLTALGGRTFDLVIEASGSASLDFALFDLLGPNGALVLTGIPTADAPPFSVAGGRLLRRVVLDNQAVIGSVNANRSYFERGLGHLSAFRERWGDVAARLVTSRRPIAEFAAALEGKPESGIKTVLAWPPATT